VEQQPGWPEYLDSLELYLQQVSNLLAQKTLKPLPTLIVTQPGGPIPTEHTERVGVLLAKSQRVESLMAIWVEEVLSSMRSIERRRRVEPCRVTGLVDSVL
jgi:hypothetical protein